MYAIFDWYQLNIIFLLQNHLVDIEFLMLIRKSTTCFDLLCFCFVGTVCDNIHAAIMGSISATTEKQSSGNVSGMLSLHTRLQQEAEKIRKWKVQTEVELKHKVW